MGLAEECGDGEGRGLGEKRADPPPAGPATARLSLLQSLRFSLWNLLALAGQASPESGQRLSSSL